MKKTSKEEQIKKALITLAECIDVLEYPMVKDNPQVIKRVDLIKSILRESN